MASNNKEKQEKTNEKVQAGMEKEPNPENDTNLEDQDEQEQTNPEQKDEPVDAVSAPRFTKKQLLGSNWYSHQRDVLNAVLGNDKSYTHAEVAQAVADFKKGKVE